MNQCKFLPFSLLATCLLGICMLVSCKEDDDIIPSATDSKEWPYDRNMDTDVRPGDNFYMYSIGGWLASSSVAEVEYAGIATECDEGTRKRLEALDIPAFAKIGRDFANVESTKEEAMAEIDELTAMLDGIETKEEVWRMIGRLMKKGVDTFFNLRATYSGGKMYCTFWPDFTLSDDTGSRVKSYKYDDSVLRPGYLREHPELLERMRPLASTRAADEAFRMLELMAEELGISQEHIAVDSQHQTLLENLAGGVEVQNLLDFMKLKIGLNKKFVSEEGLKEVNAMLQTDYTMEYLVSEAEAKYGNYILSHAYVSKYLDAGRKRHYEEVCEEFRNAFRTRLERIDWMSSTTRQAALDKLEAMNMIIGSPYRWLDAGLPELTGSTLVGDYFQLCAAGTALRIAMAGQPARDYIMEWYMTEEPTFNLAVNNAFYFSGTNSVIVLPSFLLEPYYDDKMSDAYFYAVTSTVVGHELTHGFDDSGSQYDKDGNWRNWWTVADKMEFDERCKTLVECYNQLEVMPEELPGVYCNGEKTLGENIADLGGFLTGYDAYVARLEREGYYGEELKKQEHRYFQGFAEAWRSKYPASWAQQATMEDSHARTKERVNGVVMNTDVWYSLFDISRDDKLWLPEERRTYIW